MLLERVQSIEGAREDSRQQPSNREHTTNSNLLRRHQSHQNFIRDRRRLCLVLDPSFSDRHCRCIPRVGMGTDPRDLLHVHHIWYYQFRYQSHNLWRYEPFLSESVFAVVRTQSTRPCWRCNNCKRSRADEARFTNGKSNNCCY